MGLLATLQTLIKAKAALVEAVEAQGGQKDVLAVILHLQAQREELEALRDKCKLALQAQKEELEERHAAAAAAEAAEKQES